MPLDRHAARLLDLLARGAAPADAAPRLDDIRRGAAALAAFAAPPPPVAREDGALSHSGIEIRMRRYAPLGLGAAAAPGLVYFHGGGWVSGGLETHDAICAALAAGANCRILAVDYRLAPEHRFPAAWEDCRAAARFVAGNAGRFGVDPARLGVAGDSVGAALAVEAARALIEDGTPVALQVLLCPVMDALARTPSRRALARGHLIDERTLATFWDLYRVPGLAADDPRVSPLRAAAFSGLPRTLIHSAEFDPLVDEAALYAEALRGAGAPVTLVCHAGLIHHFYGLGGAIPAARAALGAIAEDIRAAFAAA